MALGKLILAMAMNMKENLEMEFLVEKVRCFIEILNSRAVKKQPTLVNLEIIREMAMEKWYGVLEERNSKDGGRMIKD